MSGSSPSIVNRKAKHEYHFLDTYTAGLMLKGTEVKSIREGKVQFGDAFCYFLEGELFIRGMEISPFSHGNIHNPEPKRERKLLLSKVELKRLKEKSEQQGLTIIPVRLFFNERNFVKLEIALAKGKKLYDKREDIKKRTIQREIDRG